MRKWMRDKLRRRKKPQEEAASAPAPLQPAYFEADPAAEPSAAKPEPEAVAQPSEPESFSSEPEAAPSSDASAGAKPSSDPTRPPRRRRRGGRGRRRSGPQTSSAPIAAAQQAPAPAAASPVPEHSKGVVVLAIGLPGSGKSSWFKRNNITPLSSDLLRSLLFDDPTEQGFQDLVFSNLRSMLKARLLARRPLNYVDATNLTPHERHGWVKLAKDYGYEVHAVFFDVPLEVCLERNHRRQRVVSDDVMRQMSAKLKPPAFEEGFAKITVVRVKQQAS